MKKFLRLISFILCLVMLSGCITVWAEGSFDKIKTDYLAYLIAQNEDNSKYTADDILIQDNYGNHSGYDIVVMGIAGQLVSPETGSITIAGITFTFGYAADIETFYAYKDGEFIHVSDAYDAALLTGTDIYNVALEKGDITLPEYRELWTDGNITLTLEETTATLYVSGEGRTDDYDQMFIVGGLGLESFSPVGGNSFIKHVVVEEGITYLGENFFSKCTGIETVTFPDSLEEIGDKCFDGCSGITHVIFPEGIKRIGNFCFESANLKALTFYGNAPKTKEYSILKYFDKTVYYPDGNSTWTEEYMSRYSSDITWESWSAPKIKNVANRFEDVKSNVWYTEGIQFCYDLNVVSGMTPSSFVPNGKLTRAQFVQMLAMYDGVDLEQYKSSTLQQNGWFTSFADVKKDAWYTPAVNWATKQGIAAGMSEISFAPNQPVTREHIAVFLKQYAELKGYYDTDVKGDLSVYEDAPKPDHWSYKVMQWAVGSGLISGTGADTLSPRLTATRAQACRMFMNLDAYFGGNELVYKDGSYRILKEFITENNCGGGYWPGNYIYRVSIGDFSCQAEYFPQGNNDYIVLYVCGEDYKHHFVSGSHAMCMEHSELSISGLKPGYEFSYSYIPDGENDDPDVISTGILSAEGYSESEFGYGDYVYGDYFSDGFYLNNDEYTVFAEEKRDTALDAMNAFIEHLMSECGLEYRDLFING